ncbi:MAG: TolC family protein [Deltaproteobacteria bacterium]|nr:TolC family protein [Deltaproteobacteria bacterium]
MDFELLIKRTISGICCICIVFSVAFLITGCAGLKAGKTPDLPESTLPIASNEKLPDYQSKVVLSEDSTLEDYLAYAAIHNEGLMAAYESWQAELEKVSQSAALPDPRLSYTYYIEEVETRVGPQRHRFGIQQSFPWMGTLSAREDVARSRAQSSQQAYEALKISLLYQIKQNYYELYYLNRAVRIEQENRELLSFIEKVVSTRYEVGSAQHAALIKSQVELARIDEKISNLEEQVMPVKANLNAILDRPPGSLMTVPESITIEEVAIDDEQLKGLCRQHNPELKALDSSMASQKTGIALAGKDFYPDVTLGFDYIYTDEARMPGVDDSGKDPILGTISLNVPIWRGKYNAGRNEAQAKYQAAYGKRQEKENELIAKLEMAIFRLRDARRKMALYRESLIPKAQQLLSITQQSFAAGTSDFLDLIDAQQTLLDLQLAYERSRTDHAKSWAELEMIAGGSIP